ncbi:MAG: hypothetical protein ACOC8N_06165 [Spirochaetota bacterium]
MYSGTVPAPCPVVRVSQSRVSWRIRLFFGAVLAIWVTTAPAVTGQDLDLREANVTEVRFEKIADGQYRFHVTLYHDDDGEAPDYANWWQVETPHGKVLGKRELLHSHGTAPFTRSKTIAIPAGVKVVVVRGHDMVHGFGGQAARVDLDTGEVEFFPSELE